MDHKEALEEEMATHSSILAWKILWTEECVKEWATEPAHTHAHTHTQFVSANPILIIIPLHLSPFVSHKFVFYV